MSSKKYDFGQYIDFSLNKRFGIIILNRIDRANSFTLETLQNLKTAIEYCEENNKIRGVILTGKGDSFSTGMDINNIDGSNHDELKRIETIAAEICMLLFNGKPAICAINGRNMGEGVVFSLCCDYRIAMKDSFFQMPEIFSGIFPGTGCIVLMARLIGIQWTKKMLMFAESVNSQKALEIGLIDQIVDTQEDLMKIALDKARFLFTKNQMVLNGIKLCCNHFLGVPYSEAYQLEKEAYLGWVEAKDKDQFIKAFRKKFY